MSRLYQPKCLQIAKMKMIEGFELHRAKKKGRARVKPFYLLHFCRYTRSVNIWPAKVYPFYLTFRVFSLIQYNFLCFCSFEATHWSLHCKFLLGCGQDPCDRGLEKHKENARKKASLRASPESKIAFRGQENLAIPAADKQKTCGKTRSLLLVGGQRRLATVKFALARRQKAFLNAGNTLSWMEARHFLACQQSAYLLADKTLYWVHILVGKNFLDKPCL